MKICPICREQIIANAAETCSKCGREGKNMSEEIFDVKLTPEDHQFLRSVGIWTGESTPQDLTENDLYFLKSMGIATGIAVGRPHIKTLEIFKIPLAPSRLRKYKRIVRGWKTSGWRVTVELRCGHTRTFLRSRKIPNHTFCEDCYRELRAEVCAEA